MPESCRNVTAEEIAALSADPLWVPVWEYAALKPMEGEVGSIGGVRWIERDGCRIRLNDESIPVTRIFVGAL